jgi:beta-phosphoglucomutase-like phosphatase (HAD superfamily)
MSDHVRSLLAGGNVVFSGYIFDVEGTLVDSVRQNLLSLQECLADFGIAVPYALLQLYSGLTTIRHFNSWPRI